MSRAIADAFHFLTQNDVRTILARIKAREVPGLIQFGVYGLCGGLATVVYSTMFFFLSTKVFPAMDGMMVDGKPITDALRAKDFTINATIAFLAATVVAYVTNVLFVFKTGRHHPVMEFLYFTGGSSIAFAISLLAGPWLVHQYGLPTVVAFLTNIAASILLNFAIRKFFVFKG